LPLQRSLILPPVIVISEIERSAPTVFDLVTPDDVQFAARFIKPTDPGLAPYVTLVRLPATGSTVNYADRMNTTGSL